MGEFDGFLCGGSWSLKTACGKCNCCRVTALTGAVLLQEEVRRLSAPPEVERKVHNFATQEALDSFLTAFPKAEDWVVEGYEARCSRGEFNGSVTLRRLVVTEGQPLSSTSGPDERNVEHG